MRLKGFAKDRLLLLGGGCGVVDGGPSGLDHRAGVTADRYKVFAHEFDKVGRE